MWYSSTYDGEIFFDGKIQKMVSVLSSMAATKLMHILFTHDDKEFAKYANKMPHFDCRVFQLPNKMEAANSFLWREQDACKNAISMAASHYYPHKELDGKNGSEKQEMLFSKGVNFNDYPYHFRRGSWVRRENVEVTLTPEELLAIPEKHRPVGPVIRSKIVEIDMPIFSKVINRVEVIFDGVKPLTV
jgi:tRNA(His) 5'-end guanylyltransferase